MESLIQQVLILALTVALVQLSTAQYHQSDAYQPQSLKSKLSQRYLSKLAALSDYSNQNPWDSGLSRYSNQNGGWQAQYPGPGYSNGEQGQHGAFYHNQHQHQQYQPGAAQAQGPHQFPQNFNFGRPGQPGNMNQYSSYNQYSNPQHSGHSFPSTGFQQQYERSSSLQGGVPQSAVNSYAPASVCVSQGGLPQLGEGIAQRSLGQNIPPELQNYGGSVQTVYGGVQDYKGATQTEYGGAIQGYNNSPQTEYGSAVQNYNSAPQTGYGGAIQGYNSAPQTEYGNAVQGTPQLKYDVNQGAPQTEYGGAIQDYGSSSQIKYEGVNQGAPQTEYGGAIQDYGSSPQIKYETEVQDQRSLQQPEYGGAIQDYNGASQSNYESAIQDYINSRQEYRSDGGDKENVLQSEAPDQSYYEVGK